MHNTPGRYRVNRYNGCEMRTNVRYYGPEILSDREFNTVFPNDATWASFLAAHPAWADNLPVDRRTLSGMQSRRLELRGEHAGPKQKHFFLSEPSSNHAASTVKASTKCLLQPGCTFKNEQATVSTADRCDASRGGE